MKIGAPLPGRKVVRYVASEELTGKRDSPYFRGSQRQARAAMGSDLWRRASMRASGKPAFNAHAGKPVALEFPESFNYQFPYMIWHYAQEAVFTKAAPWGY